MPLFFSFFETNRHTKLIFFVAIYLIAITSSRRNISNAKMLRTNIGGKSVCHKNSTSIPTLMGELKGKFSKKKESERTCVRYEKEFASRTRGIFHTFLPGAFR